MEKILVVDDEKEICDLIMENEELPFRATKDVALIRII